MTVKKRKLLDQVRDAIRCCDYAYKTEKSYVHWIKQYILFHEKRHPKEMSVPEIESFFTYLATDREVSGTTLNVAWSALLFLYREVLKQMIDSLQVVQAKKRERLLTILTQMAWLDDLCKPISSHRRN